MEAGRLHLLEEDRRHGPLYRLPIPELSSETSHA
jgi:hypothetical protein